MESFVPHRPSETHFSAPIRQSGWGSGWGSGWYPWNYQEPVQYGVPQRWEAGPQWGFWIILIIIILVVLALFK